MEKLLHYAWKHKILPLLALHTTDGKEVEVIDPGMSNHNQGPDFFNAKVRIDGTLWAGNIELHLRSSDWARHGHDTDPAYNNTILHVVEEADCEVRMQSGATPPQLVIPIPQQVAHNYEELCLTDDYPRCHRMIPHLSPIKAHAWMDALLTERMKERAERILARVKLMNGDWEKATFVTLCRNFGFGLNGDVFERWAQQIPLQATGKHRDNLFQIEAIFLGMAGLIDECMPQKGTEQVERLRQEYAFLAHKFALPQPMDASQWKYLRTRPSNFPHIRLLQIAALYHSGKVQMSALVEAADPKAMHRCLAVGGISPGSRSLIIINTIAPLLYAYGIYHQQEEMMQRATDLLESLPPEANYIIRQWQACGLNVRTAADSQALIQLKREYCDRKDCLRCRLAYEYLKMEKA